MRSTKTLLWILGGLLCASANVQAQGATPDVRNIQPLVMLVVDSSGSMEDLPGCTCTSDTDCSNCEPVCTLPNVAGEPPWQKKNRWAVTLEALTGTFIDFECNALDRTLANGATYDLDYSVQYHQPWKCSSGTKCTYPGTPAVPIQLSNGILDNYIETLRFGLMTFDGEYTYKGGSDLITQGAFNDARSNGIDGMWSYGALMPVRYPGCDDEYVVNSGGRSEDATEGNLISLNSCAVEPCDGRLINEEIQASLLRTRPYGGTPIAASLDDLYIHLKNELSVEDEYVTCRKRYGILITDGAPDSDFRDLGCDCNKPGNPACPEDEVEADMKCPYPEAPVLAKKLVTDAGSSDPKQLDKLFVLGMSVSDVSAKAKLNLIASNGGSTPNADGNEALFADSPATLRATLDQVFSQLLSPTSRSVPAFAIGVTGTQYQISSGFQVSAEAPVAGIAQPWSGVIERRRFICDRATGEIQSPDIGTASGDRFAEVLNAQDISKRDLWTAFPAGTPTRVELNGKITRGEPAATCNSGYCDRVELDTTEMSATLLDTSPAERETLIDWMYGKVGSVRENRKLGDVYHSSPALVGAPIDEPIDEAYALFREKTVVKERPLVMYVGTNDGILHAFSVEEFPLLPVTTHAAKNYEAGEEIWGFVPPMFVDDLKGQLTAHQLMMDGTPVVKDVYFKRESTGTDAEYRTVLISGMRSGGNGYIALDVTDPFEPKFLWQFNDEDMGETYGQPEIIQARVMFPERVGDTPTLQTRAIAILPGGKGTKKVNPLPLTGCSFGKTLSQRKDGAEYFSRKEETVGKAVHRSYVQCWEKEGRSLYFVDVATGRVIKKIFDNDLLPSTGLTLPSPIVGTPTAYPDTIGTVATQGFVMDADGVLWRIDMSETDPVPDDPKAGWTMRPFHDLFFDKPDVETDTTFEKPIISFDEQRRVVVIVGTGDTDNFEKSGANNRVVSLTEVVGSGTGADKYEALLNWELRNQGPTGHGFTDGELVTGTMALFDGQLFFASFISESGTSDACDYGRGRLWSVDYVHRDLSAANTNYNAPAIPGTYAPIFIPVPTDSADPTSDANLFNTTVANARKNLLIQGLGTTQRLACSADEEDFLNSYFSPSLANIEENSSPSIWVVAQASGGEQRANAALGGIQSAVPRAKSFSRVTSWATSVD